MSIKRCKSLEMAVHQAFKYDMIQKASFWLKGGDKSMLCIIFANGEYGSLEAYASLLATADLVLCADGGANYAYEMNILPAMVVGDLDSISPHVENYFKAKDVSFKKLPRQKDFTDIQLTLGYAQKMGVTKIILFGTLGKRLDHALANLFCSIESVLYGIDVCHYSPECSVHVIHRELQLIGKPGDIVSVLPLGSKATGVTEIGFEYSLKDAELEVQNPYSVSNRLMGEQGYIKVQSGILAVFHYHL